MRIRSGALQASQLFRPIPNQNAKLLFRVSDELKK